MQWGSNSKVKAEERVEGQENGDMEREERREEGMGR